MPVAGPTARTPADARSIEAGMLLIGAGALLLFVSLFLEWYQPGIDAWEIFEVWALVLAVLAVVALVGVAGRLGVGPPRPASWLIGPALATLVIVLYLLINPPPLSTALSGGGDGDPSTGLWLALASGVLMTAGALLSVARISVAISPADSFGADRHGARVAGDPLDPAPGPGPAPGGPGPGGPGPATPGPATPGRPAAGPPPTDPTRRI